MTWTTLTHLMRRRSQRDAVRAAQQERRRLARDLHDGLGQDLYATNLDLEALKHRLPVETHPQIEQLIHRQVAMIHTARRLIDDRTHRPDVSVPVDEFMSTLTDLVDVELGHAPTVDVDPKAPEDIPETVAYHATYALREMISNAVRHSASSMIVVMIDLDPATVDLSVTDDGMGFDEPTTLGRGLTNLRDRARQCGGRFTLRSTPGVGTTAHWRAPLRSWRVPPLVGLLRSA
jgi:two-component system sensor histidine kinase DevS